MIAYKKTLNSLLLEGETLADRTMVEIKDLNTKLETLLSDLVSARIERKSDLEINPNASSQRPRIFNPEE